MVKPGSIALLRFPHTDLARESLRPVLLLAPTPDPYPDWLVAMISSQMHQAVHGLVEVIHERDPDFPATGLKRSSVVRLSRLAVVEEKLLLGKLGEISPERFRKIVHRLCSWITASLPG